MASSKNIIIKNAHSQATSCQPDSYGWQTPCKTRAFAVHCSELLTDSCLLLLVLHFSAAVAASYCCKLLLLLHMLLLVLHVAATAHAVTDVMLPQRLRPAQLRHACANSADVHVDNAIVLYLQVSKKVPNIYKYTVLLFKQKVL